MSFTRVKVLKTAFNSGILSPLLDARSELEKYPTGCRLMRNFIPRTYGAAFKRAGTEYLGRVKAGDGVTRLMQFNYSVNTRFVFEFGEGYLRFWSNGTRVNAPITAVSQWSGTAASYNPGDWVSDNVTGGGKLYAAKNVHVPSVGNEPPSAQWTTTNTKLWATGVNYTIGDLVMGTIAGWLYVVKSTHLSTTSPDIDTTHYKLLPRPAEDDWFASVSYAVGDIVLILLSGLVRANRCIKAHTSGASSKPGSAGSATYWENIDDVPAWTTTKVYKIRDFVVQGGSLYVCVVDHTSGTFATDLAAVKWVVKTTYTPWVQASTSRSPGDVVLFGGGQIAAATQVHTSVTVPDFITGKFTRVGGIPWTASPTYAAGSVVYDGTNAALYYALQTHSTTSTTEPATTGGEPYWQRLRNVFNWTTATNYLANQYVFNGGNTYRVVSDHTSGTFATDLANGLLVLAPYPLELDTPYGVNDIFGVNSVQVNDLTWLLHPAHEPMLLSRYGDTLWKIGSVPWVFPPMRDENFVDDFTITPSATTGLGITLTASKALFVDQGMIGSYFAIAQRRDNSTSKLALSAVGSSTPVKLVGKYDIFIYGTVWKGEVVLESSHDGSTNWQQLRSWNQPVANMRTIATSGDTGSETLYLRLRMTVYTAGAAATDYAIIEAANSRITGLVKITGITSQSVATANVIKDMINTTATTSWSESSFSNYRGWPRAGTLHELRLVLAGNTAEPQAVHSSVTDSFFDFTFGTEDTAGLSYTVASTEGNLIQWVASFAGALLIGTAGEEFTATSGADGKALSPTNPPQIKPQGHNGSSAVWPVKLADALLFFPGSGEKVIELTFDILNSKYLTPDLTLLSEQIAATGIKQVAVVRQPDRTLLCVLNDGRMISLTYERDQNVVAWSEYKTDGGAAGTSGFDSVAVIYGGTAAADEVWVVAKRVVQGVTRRFVERIHPGTAKFRFDFDAAQLCYMDSSIYQELPSPDTVVTGLDHLNGRFVFALYDGKTVTSGLTVSGGSITLPEAATKVRVGLSYQALLQGMKLETVLQDGTAQGRTFEMTSFFVRTYQSNGFQYVYDPDDATVPERDADTGELIDVALRTTKPTDFHPILEQRPTDQLNLRLLSQKPLPVNILAIGYTFNVSGD